MIRLLQLEHTRQGRAIGIVNGDTVSLLNEPKTAYDAARAALKAGTLLADFLSKAPVAGTVPYAEVWGGSGEWKVLPSFDHPAEPARCLVSGTGLTHLASAETRSKMHQSAENETDSMKMYRWGEEGGRPEAGKIGVAPEWFYKGSGQIVRAHNEPLDVPAFAGDGGEEPEIAGIYLIDDGGAPWRVGMSQGNEFSDHKTEKINYLYLAPSKLRQCSIGPELIVEPEFDDVPGTVKIERKGEVVWSKEIGSGEKRMSYSLANMEHHHFKFPEHRRPGDVHIHFFGAGAFSFGAGVELSEGDVMELQFEGFGRPLRNWLRVETRAQKLVEVRRA